LKDIHPGDLKNGAAEHLNRLLEPIRKDFETKEMQQLILDAYPPPAPIQQKKSKKIKRLKGIL
jgi:tyrosyl-tRNA synthetase